MLTNSSQRQVRQYQDKKLPEGQLSSYWIKSRGSSFKTHNGRLTFRPFSNSSIPTSSALLKSSGGSGSCTWCLSTVTTRFSMSWTDTKEGECASPYKPNTAKHTRVCKGRLAITLFQVRQKEPGFWSVHSAAGVDGGGITKNVGREVVSNHFHEESSSSIIRMDVISLLPYLCIIAESLR